MSRAVTNVQGTVLMSVRTVTVHVYQFQLHPSSLLLLFESAPVSLDRQHTLELINLQQPIDSYFILC
jgi:hypothetical protein